MNEMERLQKRYRQLKGVLDDYQQHRKRIIELREAIAAERTRLQQQATTTLDAERRAEVPRNVTELGLQVTDLTRALEEVLTEEAECWEELSRAKQQRLELA